MIPQSDIVGDFVVDVADYLVLDGSFIVVVVVVVDVVVSDDCVFF